MGIRRTSRYVIALLLTLPGFAAAGEPEYPVRRITMGGELLDLALADLDGDGWLDLAGAAEKLAIRRGAEQNGFGPLQTYGTGGASFALALADLDDDGDSDAAVANWSLTGTKNVAILSGDGDGTFAPPVGYATYGGPSDVLLGDLDGDSVEDMVVLTGQGFGVRLGTGTGAFGAETKYPQGTNCDRGRLRDFDGNGTLDLAFTCSNAEEVRVLSGLGDGSFAAAMSTPAGHFPRDLDAGDIDGDGLADIVLASGGSQSFALVLWGHGDGSFESLQPVGPGYAYGRGVVIADVNRDGLQDVALSGYGGLWLAAGVGNRSFAPPSTFVSGSESSAALVLADTDLDGDLDAYVADWGSGDVGVIESDVPGSYTAATLLPGPATGWQNPSLAIGDFDGDGVTDAFTTNAWTDTGATWLGDGAGSFDVAATLGVPDLVRHAAPADLDQDGMLDLLLLDATTDSGVVLTGSGDGGFTSGPTLPLGSDPRESVLADLDGDGVLDALVAEEEADRLELLLGQPAGTLVAAGNWPVGDRPRSVDVADIDGDGVLDALAGNSGSDDVTLRLGDGLGGFGGAKTFPALGAIQDLRAVDIDEDGRTDALTADFSNNAVGILRNEPQHGQPGFDAIQLVDLPYIDASGPNVLLLEDLDGDGHVDVITGQDNGNRIGLLRGTGDGLLPAELFAASETAVHLRAGDWNGDGEIDLLSATDALAVYLNLSSAPWSSLGLGLAGSAGIPHLHGSGDLQPGSPVSLVLAHARPTSSATLVVGLAQLALPFKGGTLVPSPDLALAGLVTDGSGALSLAATWPAGLPAGTNVFLQAWIADPAGPHGFAASGAQRASAP